MQYQSIPAPEQGTVRSLLWRRPRLSLLVVALGSVILGGGLATVLTPGEPASPKLGAPLAPAPVSAAMTVTVAPVEAVSWPVMVKASGAIAPWQEAIVGAPLGGMPLVDLAADVGDSVTRGQVLARFESDTLRAEKAELEAGVAEARATLREAEANRERALAMGPVKALSEQEIQQYVTRATTAKARLASAEARLASKQVQLGHTEVKAPDDGVISARSATLGSVAASGQELFRLIRQHRLEWRGELNASQVGQVVVGQTVVLALADGSKTQAKIRTIAPAMDNQSRLARVYADLVPGSTARAGMYVDGVVELAPTPALTVPARSLVIRDGYSFVFVLDRLDQPVSRVARQRVEVGRRRGAEAEILSGLEAGAMVAVDGAGFLTDGDGVRIAGKKDVGTQP